MITTTKNDLEIEVKFFISDVQSTRRKIISLGGELKAKVFESNVRYEDQTQSLQNRRMLLRLRKDKQVHLTVKIPPPRENPEFKILRELEVTVNDFSIMDQILITLGFHQAQVYEKWRETLIFEQTLLCMDALPFGNFLEIEGSEANIRAAVDALGLDWRRRILSNYLEIFEYLKQKEGLEFKDVTFANFKKHPIQFGSYCRFFEAG